MLHRASFHFFLVALLGSPLLLLLCPAVTSASSANSRLQRLASDQLQLATVTAQTQQTESHTPLHPLDEHEPAAAFFNSTTASASLPAWAMAALPAFEQHVHAVAAHNVSARGVASFQWLALNTTTATTPVDPQQAALYRPLTTGTQTIPTGQVISYLIPAGYFNFAWWVKVTSGSLGVYMMEETEFQNLLNTGVFNYLVAYSVVSVTTTSYSSPAPYSYSSKAMRVVFNPKTLGVTTYQYVWNAWTWSSSNIALCRACTLNQGVCTAAGTCECVPGYSGTTCETLDPVCTPACVNGRCTGTNVCTCNSGWRGSTCDISIPVCTAGCANGGTCIANNVCSCPVGWTGATCSTPVCSSTCLNGGACTAPNTCTCAFGYKGPTCTQFDCPAGCGPSAQGSCTGPNTCTCSRGWKGSACDQMDCSNMGGCGEASGRGQCTIPLTQCTCSSGWYGANCDSYYCAGGCGAADGSQGSCVSGNTCSCASGWTGPNCITPVCDRDCSGSTHGLCTAPNTCKCQPGWTGKACETAVDYSKLTGGTCGTGTGTGTGGTNKSTTPEKCSDITNALLFWVGVSLLAWFAVVSVVMTILYVQQSRKFHRYKIANPAGGRVTNTLVIDSNAGALQFNKIAPAPTLAAPAHVEAAGYDTFKQGPVLASDNMYAHSPSIPPPVRLHFPDNGFHASQTAPLQSPSSHYSVLQPNASVYQTGLASPLAGAAGGATSSSTTAVAPPSYVTGGVGPRTARLSDNLSQGLPPRDIPPEFGVELSEANIQTNVLLQQIPNTVPGNGDECRWE